MFDAILELFERRSSKDQRHSRLDDSDRRSRERDDSTYHDGNDDHRDSQGNPSKRRRFADLLDGD